MLAISCRFDWLTARRRLPETEGGGPHELAFSTLKALLRRATARTYDDLWKAVGHVSDLFTEEEC